MDRRSRLLAGVGRTQQIVEIGAGYTPVAAKADGWRTHVVDHASKDELRLKYSGHGAAVHLADVDVNVIEDVDTIWLGGPLHQAVPADLLGKVDLIIASHVLEHLPDLIGFLQSASHLLSPDGGISIAIPDRRYCFDCFKPWTTTGELLDAHRRGSNRHSLKTAFNHMAYSATADGQLGWGARPISPPTLMDPFESAADIVARFREDADGPYQDYHAWQFTPAGFQLTMLELAALGLSGWSVVGLEAPGSFEFFVQLRHGCVAVLEPAALQRRRRDLLIAQLVETRKQIDLMLGVGTGSAAKPEAADQRRSRAGNLVGVLHTIWQRIRGGRYAEPAA